TVSTNNNGIYKLRQIKERETLHVKVSAEGYTDSTLTIEGWKFSNRKETRYVFLKKNKDVIKNRIIIGSISSNTPDPLYIINGKPARAIAIHKLDATMIESIEVLKPPAAAAIYGKAARAGAIIITTKKDLAKTGTNQHKNETITRKNTIPQLQVPTITVTPNPVRKGSMVTVSFTSTLQGEYNLQVATADGKIIQHKKILVPDKQTQLQLQTGAAWASGWYYISISNNKGEPAQAGKFIIE
ncbi:MAG: TonB-dependent receptor plug domain-containing protein, partial [Chitinophagaceae bacterium]|nr:TonB-dependent receptor plug domain-containing protein [Chitinophagaceae bacterium]